ncbi:uncharacterized protein LOC5505465 [Nematostella vectensis]|uniref:uncharacterized protein LOC5505465 n=1 Tax=Nematostella vectensis TaxID=45351 RepID=UPI00207738F3|nr:uncharacterized protein LOC5505465 [Nematostella vectensis]
MVKRTKLLGIISSFHLVFGVFSVVLGIVTFKVAPYFYGVFGMGVWLGAWMLITGVAGLLTASVPTNMCRLGSFIGCSLVGLVTLFVCAIIIGLGVLQHFKFESSINREYYIAKGPNYHKEYSRPQEHFDERNQNGKNGVGIYGTLLALIVMDVIVNLVTIAVCKEIIKKTQLSRSDHSGNMVNAPQRTNNRGVRRSLSPPQVALPTVNQPFVEGESCLYISSGIPKLPSYIELFPEETVPLPPTSHPSVAINATPSPTGPAIPNEAPPAYTP